MLGYVWFANSKTQGHLNYADHFFYAYVSSFCC